ncbi:hypothetical protein Tco_0588794 [Tanacetum coccineum]
MLDKKELTITLDDFRQIFHLPQATDNNHSSFVPPPSFFDMVPFYKQVLGFTMELKTQSNFKTTGLLQPWQTLCKIFSKCLTARVTGWDQPPLQIMQMLYCFFNNIHVDYAELLWEGTDKSKITRKQSKSSKHGHENQKSTKPKPEKPKTLAHVLLVNHKGQNCKVPKLIYN